MLAKRKAATRPQQAYQDAARSLGCVVCGFRFGRDEYGHPKKQAGGTEIHHRTLDDKHGQKQLGQHAVVAMCSYHHRGVPNWGWSDEEMREAYGPSFALHARDFREWTADVLPDLPGRGTERWQGYQDQLLGEEHD